MTNAWSGGGRVEVTVRCNNCSRTTTQWHNVGGILPAYCGPHCRRAARRYRKKRGIMLPPPPPAPLGVCQGCDAEAHVGRRGEFTLCVSCRGRLNACIRKKMMATVQDAIDMAAWNQDINVYRCPICLYWHMTSHLASDVETDQELGERLRGMGFTRTNFVKREEPIVMVDAEAEFVEGWFGTADRAKLGEPRTEGKPYQAYRMGVDDAAVAIAYRIRAELVCCDVYDRAQGNTVNLGPHDKSHLICFWGEGAARLAEEVAAVGLEQMGSGDFATAVRAVEARGFAQAMTLLQNEKEATS